MKIISPWDGDFVNSRDGIRQGENLVIKVKLLAEKDAKPVINGKETIYDEKENVFFAEVSLAGVRNCIIAKTAEEEERITVFVMPDEHLKKFRVSSDDNIRFLQELTYGDYNSIFDHPYLAVYKKAHDLYGAKVHLNLFYAFDDQARGCFSKNHEYFDLSMMTDRYKDEFKANSDWLKLAFHAKSEFPGAPYKHATGETVRKDCIAVCREICRFAGKECISNSTTVHFGEANRDGVRALRELGFTSLTGYFELTEKNQPLVSYYADEELIKHVGARDFWMDTQENMIFGRIDRVMNLGSLEEVLQAVEGAADDPFRGGFVSIMIHEQYFYSDYINYLPDFEQRVLQSCSLLAERGYTSALISEVTAERNLADHPYFAM